MADYDDYCLKVKNDIAKTISEKGCQPILFIGSGFSKRYRGAPNWEDLLTKLKAVCPKIQHDVAYYLQSKKTLPEVGSIYSSAFKEWAWVEGRSSFPEELFKSSMGEDIFIKNVIANILRAVSLDFNGDFGDVNLNAEIESLKAINPHALITTNYDQLLEPIFPDYVSIVGQQVIRHSYMSIGEIFKIHGCISDPASLLFTYEDYQRFSNDKKYLSAKLLAYFVEHPLLFIGYSANDKNIQAILQEISRMMPIGDMVIPNIYILEWDGDLKNTDYPSLERVVDLGAGESLRLKSIVTNRTYAKETF